MPPPTPPPLSPQPEPPPPGRGRGRNRVHPEHINALRAAIQRWGQALYPAGSMVPPYALPQARWPMLGAPLPARAWQTLAWLNEDTRPGQGSLPGPVRREVARYLRDSGLDATLSPQDLMRALASLARHPTQPEQAVPDDQLDRMVKLMKNQRGFAEWPQQGASVGVMAQDTLRRTLAEIERGRMPQLWARYALRVVMHAMGLSLQHRASLWLLRDALLRAARDVSLHAPAPMAAAATLMRREWENLMLHLLPGDGMPPKGAAWETTLDRWTQQDPRFNPLRYADDARPSVMRDGMAQKLAEAGWPEDFADHLHACAWAVARELMDGTRYLDFDLHRVVMERELRAPPGTPAPGANKLHHLATLFKKQRGNAGRLHDAPDAALFDQRRSRHHTHFRVMADHRPMPEMHTPESARGLDID